MQIKTTMRATATVQFNNVFAIKRIYVSTISGTHRGKKGSQSRWHALITPALGRQRGLFGQPALLFS